MHSAASSCKSLKGASNWAQIESILSNLDSFQAIVDRNYDRLLQVGTWRSRASVIVEAAEQLAARSAPQPALTAQEHN